MNPVPDTKFDLKQHIAAWYIIFMLNMLHIVIGNVLHISTQLLGGIFMAGFCAAILILPDNREQDRYSYTAWVCLFFLVMSLPYFLVNTNYDPFANVSCYIRVIGIFFMFHALRSFKGPKIPELFFRVSAVTLLLQSIALVIFIVDPNVSKALFYIETKSDLDNIDFLTRFSGTVGEINILPYLCLFSGTVLLSPQIKELHPRLKKTFLRGVIILFTGCCFLLSGSRGAAVAALLLITRAIWQRKLLMFSFFLLLALTFGLWHSAGPSLLAELSNFLGENNIFERLFGNDSHAAQMAEVSAELRWTIAQDALTVFWRNPFAVRGIFFANYFAEFGLPHCGPIYLLFSYGITGLYPIYIFFVKNYFIARRNHTFPIYIISLPLLFLSVDSFYFFVLPWMSIGLEKLTSAEPAPVEEDTAT